MAPATVPADHTHETWWDPHQPLVNDKQKAAFMDFLEHGLDFFGCDENVTKKVVGKEPKSLRIANEAHEDTDLQRLDYAKLHDELLESLMAEQSKKANDPAMADFESSASSFSFSSSNNSHLLNVSSSTANTSFDSYGADADADVTPTEESLSEIPAFSSSNSTKRGHKRPRALKLHRRVMPTLASKASSDAGKTIKRKLSSNSSFSSKSTAASSKRLGSKMSRAEDSEAVHVSLSELNEANFPPASSFIHPQCRLQKDKGKGEPAGSNICAKGRDHCLMKLEQKIALLTRVAFGEESKNKGTADMKRRPARVAEIFPNFTETRSIIELRMGFLSMQYGILLRWDTSRTGKVTLVVLRKMCHDSFYTKCKVPKKVSPRKMIQIPAEPPSLAIRNVIGKHAILQRPDGLEVALLEPPYRVDRPIEFPPTLLSVDVRYATGLTHKSSWTAQLCYDGKTENILLAWDPEQEVFSPKLGDTLRQEIPVNSSVDLQHLEVRLFEHRQRRGKSRRCVSQMYVSLLDLEAQPASRKATPKDLKVEATHDPDACITLSVLLQSDYAHWLHRELDARRREEVKAFVWKTPFRVVDLYDDTAAVTDDEDDSIWEWICGAC